MSNSTIFGTWCSYEDSNIIIIPVPWDVTASYGSGASLGPQHIIHASSQLDFFDLTYGVPLDSGIHILEIPQQIMQRNNFLRQCAKKIQEKYEDDIPLSPEDIESLHTINQACCNVHNWVEKQAERILFDDKIPVLLGGDHSTPFGLIRTWSNREDFGILHIDAHADLRDSYQGFHSSHASIMHNVMNLPTPPQKLVQVGIRDLCIEEYDISKSHPSIHTYFDPHLKDRMFKGETWERLCKEICEQLPEKVYISFDIDGLSPLFCPGTGTPVPGGLSFDQARFLIKTLAQSDRTIIGFDVSEVAPSPQGEWDGNVGARVLYQLIGGMLYSQK
ncbi:MAG: hypothetical protein CL916_09435 [Deltaproteobacteria bacterium]|nr:hypothetical protein [Deltaproteobacteria bacterium]